MLVENIIIKKVSDVHEGTSETTGKKWASRIILLAFEDETGESYISAAVDKAVWDSLGFEEGQQATLHLRFRTKKFMNGFISNDIRIINPQIVK